jgi:rRNA maturation RNase YbeY
LRLLRRLALEVLARMPGLATYELGVRLVDAAQIAAANQRFLRRAGPTDVIAFDYSDPSPEPAGLVRESAPDFAPARQPCNLPLRPAAQRSSARRGCRKNVRCAHLHGDLLICLDMAQEQAKRFRTCCASELVRYLVHGLLHLRGYDDADAPSRRTMKREEDRLVRRLARRFPLRELILEPKLAR